MVSVGEAVDGEEKSSRHAASYLTTKLAALDQQVLLNTCIYFELASVAECSANVLMSRERCAFQCGRGIARDVDDFGLGSVCPTYNVPKAINRR